ncbi:MAG: VWA domain-containing protein [Candidatus Hydrogenedens sp.]|nr:VWA domain-containing protein [Candidatus Hydrogenedens sp.]
MPGRRLTFVLCVAVAALLFAGILQVAPEIVLMRPMLSEKSPRTTLFRVQLKPVSAAVRTEPAPEARRLATRPGSMEQLIQSDNAPASLPEAVPPAPPAAAVADRVAADALPSEAAMKPDAQSLKRVDERIIEIAARDARAGIDAPRRLVRPSPNTLLPEGAEPTLRSPLSDDAVALPIAMPAASLLLAESPAGEPASIDERPASAPPAPQVPASAADTLRVLPSIQAIEDAKETSAYTFMDDLLELGLDVYRPDAAQPGYFRLVIRPKQGTEVQALPKQLVFVIDASRSIPQHKLRASCKGVLNALEVLRAGDTFNIYLFRDTATAFKPQPVALDDTTRAEAKAFLDAAEASGETDVYQALLPVVQAPPAANGPSIVLLISDGRPTVGIQDGRTLINGLTSDNADRHTVFAYAGGNNVNQPMLDLLAYRNRGASGTAADVNAMEAGIQQFAQRLRDPMLVNCAARFASLDASSVFPQRLPDFYAGRAVTLYGRYDPALHESFAVQLTGDAGSGKKEVIFRAAFDQAQSGDAAIARGWAFEKAYHLIGEISRAGETPELLAELRALSKQYGIHTSYDE